MGRRNEIRFGSLEKVEAGWENEVVGLRKMRQSFKIRSLYYLLLSALYVLLFSDLAN